MFTHVRVGSADIDKSKAFYDATFQALGMPTGTPFGHNVMYQSPDGGRFMFGTPIAGEATHANGGTIGFAAPSPDAVAAWHAAGLANGGTCEGAPGPREMVGGAHGAYLRDPDGNKLSAYAFQGA